MAAAAVHYKFKSAKEFDRIPIEGQAISVASLKNRIICKLRLGGPCDFDLVVEDAHTGQEYLDEEFMVQENTRVLVRRVPRIRDAGIVGAEAKQGKVNGSVCCKESSPSPEAKGCRPKDVEEEKVQLADEADVEEQLDYEGLDAEDYNIDDLEETPETETLKESAVGEVQTVDLAKEAAAEENGGKDATHDGQPKKPYGFPWKSASRHPYAVQYTGYWQASQMLAANNCRLPYGYNAFFPGVPFAHAPFPGYAGRTNNADVRRERRRFEQKRGRNVRRSPSPQPRTRRSPTYRLSPRTRSARTPPRRYRSRSPVTPEYRPVSPARSLRRKCRRSRSPRHCSLSPVPRSMSPRRDREVKARPSSGDLNRMIDRDRDRDGDGDGGRGRDRERPLKWSRSLSRSGNPSPPERCGSRPLGFHDKDAADVTPRTTGGSSLTHFCATEPGPVRACKHVTRPSGRAAYDDPAIQPVEKRTVIVARLEPRRNSSSASVHDDLEGSMSVQRACSLPDAEYQLERDYKPCVRRPVYSQGSFRDEVGLLAENDFGLRLYVKEADELEYTRQPRLATLEREKVLRRCLSDDAFDNDMYGEVVDDDYAYDTQAEALRVRVQFSRGSTRRVVLAGQGSAGTGEQMEAAGRQPRLLPVSAKKRTAVFVSSEGDPVTAGGPVGKKRKGKSDAGVAVKSKRLCSQARSVFDRIGPPINSASGAGRRVQQQRMVVGYGDLD